MPRPTTAAPPATSRSSKNRGPRKARLRLDDLEVRALQGSVVNGLVAAAVGAAMGEPIQVMAAVAGDVALFGAHKPSKANATEARAQDPPAERPTHHPDPLPLDEPASRKPFESASKVETDGPADVLAGKSVLTDVDIESLLTVGDLGTPKIFRATWPAADAKDGGAGGARGLDRPDVARGGGADEGRVTRPGAEPDQSVAEPPTSAAGLGSGAGTGSTAGAVAASPSTPVTPEVFVTPPVNKPTPEPPAPTQVRSPSLQATTHPLFAVGTDAGSIARVKVYDAPTLDLQYTLLPYAPAFHGGVRVAVGDVTGDGTSDVVVGQGPGGANRVRVYNGATGLPVLGLANLTPFSTAESDGVWVAAGDVTGDGRADIVVGTDDSAHPAVRVFSGVNGSLLGTVPLEDDFRGGARVAAGDANGDGLADLTVGAGPGARPRVQVFDGGTGQVVQDLFAFDAYADRGVRVAAADTNGDGTADLFAGVGDGQPGVRVFRGGEAAALATVAPNPDPLPADGRIAAADLDGDGRTELLVGDGPGGGRLRAVDGLGGDERPMVAAPFGPFYQGGLFVAADPAAAAPGGVSLLLVTPVATVDVLQDVMPENMPMGPGSAAKQLKFRVSLSGSGGPPILVRYSLTGTATGSDYGAQPGGVFVSPGSSVDFSFVPVHDSIIEYAETVVVTVIPDPNNPTSYDIGSPSSAAGAIIDDEAPPPVVGDCGCGGGKVADGAGAPPGPGQADGGVAFGTGALGRAAGAADLSADGFGVPWAQSRAWTNSLGSNTPSGAAGWSSPGAGTGVVATDLPYLLKDSAGKVAYVENGQASRLFTPNQAQTVYTESHYLRDTLTPNASPDEYTLTDAAGNRLVFYGFTSPAGPAGALKSFAAADGGQVTVSSGSTTVSEVQRSATVGGTTTTESFLYTYITSGSDPNYGKLASVVLRRQVGAGGWQPVRSTEYTYYPGVGTDANGPVGSLKTVVVKDAGGTVLDRSYYRYYIADSATSYIAGLKYAVGPASYARLQGAYPASDPTTLSDNQIAPYADLFLEYDRGQRVKTAVVQGDGCSACSGGLGTYTYTYKPSTFADGYNLWRFKTVETRPDGNTRTVYTNFAGQPMLEVDKDTASGQEWLTFRKYDSVGREVLVADPSAVSGYDETTGDLMNNQSGNFQYLRDGQGLITTTGYYGTTTATASTAGGVLGSVSQTAVQRGDTGTSVLQSATDYLSRTDGSITVYPVANSTMYRNTNGTGGQATSHAYSWYSGTIQPEQVTTTRPTVTTAQNGPNAADTSTVAMDAKGRVIWEKDGGGFLTYTAYDEATGAVAKVIRDVDVSQTGTFANLPSGWTTPSGGGLHQTTTYEVDALGRTTKSTDPNGNITYTVYKDTDHEVRVYAGWDTGTSAPTGPTQVYREDRALGYTESLTMSATPTTSSGRPTGAESISGVQTLSRTVLNAAGQAVYQDQYFDLTGVTYSASSVTLGTAGTNYARTETGYDQRGRVNKTVTPTGTIYRTESDSLGRVVSQWVGTDDTPTSGFWSPSNLTGTNMVKVSEDVYDDTNWDGDGTDVADVGDGLLSHRFEYPSDPVANPSEVRRTDFAYDWRNRQVAAKAAVQGSESTSLNRPISYTEYDNLGQAVASEMYDGDGLSITTDANTDGVPDRPSSGALRAKSTAEYDEQGRAFRTKTYSVDPSSGSVSSNALTSNTSFDHRGQVIKTAAPGGLVSKTAYNGLGWVTAGYTTDGGGDSGWGDADDVTGDAVLSQAEPTYDAGGRTLMTTAKERFHDETGTGALGTPTTGVKTRVSYSAAYYDKADRTTAVVDVGTNGGSAYTRPGSVPSRSDTVLVTEFGYNAAGWTETMTDPKTLVNKTFYDNAGRVTKTIENYVNGTVSDADDKTVEYTYDAAGHQKTLKALLTGGGYQTTEWVYGITSPVVSNDVLKEMRYPDTSSGNASSSEKDAYTYNQLGQVLTKTDRNGSVHTYTYDVLGRVTVDTVSTLGSGVDGAVRRVETSYDGQGNAYLITSYNATSSGTVVNQVQREFDGLGQLTREWQAVGGSVNTSTSPSVQYAYSFAPSGSTNHSRLTSITYPNGRVLTYNYASGLSADISRLSSISDGGTTLESYDYLGLGTVVTRAHPQPGVDLTYVKYTGESDGDAGDKYTGLDRFGRVVDQRWTTSTPTAKDRWQSGYDRDGNRLYKENLVDSSRSELYAYDGLNQLTSFDRGTLNGTKTGLTGAASRAQDFDFDALGNWDSLTTDGGTAQTRGHNKQNEITSISGATTPTYDANGNLTKDETGRTFKYDAWNRLVQVKNSGGTTLADYTWDGLGRRVTEARSGTTTSLYYSAAWQVLEERVGSAVKASYAWSPVYVDAMVARDRDTDANGSLDERLYAVQDANFNVTALLNTSGTVVERFAYDPFGGFTVLDGSWGNRGSSNYAWTYLHQGGRWDADAGVYSFRNREYSPILGRWLQMDPIGFYSESINLYAYNANNAPVAVDPLGLKKGKVFVFAYEGAGGRNFISHQPIAPSNEIGQLIINQIKALRVDVDYRYFNSRGWGFGLGLFAPGAYAQITNEIVNIRKNKLEPCSAIIITGYSWGAVTAALDAQKASDNTDYKFALVFTIDPVTTLRNQEAKLTKGFGASEYAKVWHNWYQQIDTRFSFGFFPFRGLPIDGATNFQVNLFVTRKGKPIPLDESHNAIPYDQWVQGDLRNEVSRVARSVQDG